MHNKRLPWRVVKAAQPIEQGFLIRMRGEATHGINSGPHRHLLAKNTNQASPID